MTEPVLTTFDGDRGTARITLARPERRNALSGEVIEALGDAIFLNVFLLGTAYQRGLLPLTLAAIDRALELNGTAVETNKRAFALGRAAGISAA